MPDLAYVRDQLLWRFARTRIQDRVVHSLYLHLLYYITSCLPFLVVSVPSTHLLHQRC